MLTSAVATGFLALIGGDEFTAGNEEQGPGSESATRRHK
jgi:hypothetical protein